MNKVIENLNIEEMLNKKEIYIVGSDGGFCNHLIQKSQNGKTILLYWRMS